MTASFAEPLPKSALRVKKTLQYAQAFTAKNTLKRKHYLKRWYLAVQKQCPIVYIDETGFAPSTHRDYGWAAKGQKVHGLQQANVRPRTSLIGGYSNHKLLAPMLFDGTCNANVFNEWLEVMLLPCLVMGSVIVMDNAAFHKSDTTRRLIEEAGCELLFLSPYSPDLNPIEKLWANLKEDGDCFKDQLMNS